MAVTHTNRKGRTYFLCRGVTKTGKVRYFFSQKAKDNLVEAIPEGYEITESVNGVVSLAKVRPALLLETEIVAVRDALENHPRTELYRMDVRSRRITIYECAGPDPQDLARDLVERFGWFGSSTESLAQRIESDRLAHAQFSPVMRFTLTGERRRRFRAERMCYLGSIDDWIDIGFNRPIGELVRELIPALGSDEFFELF